MTPLLYRHLADDKTVILMMMCSALIVAYITFLAGINRTENKVQYFLIMYKHLQRMIFT